MDFQCSDRKFGSSIESPESCSHKSSVIRVLDLCFFSSLRIRAAKSNQIRPHAVLLQVTAFIHQAEHILVSSGRELLERNFNCRCYAKRRRELIVSSKEFDFPFIYIDIATDVFPLAVAQLGLYNKMRTLFPKWRKVSSSGTLEQNCKNFQLPKMH